MLEHVREDDRVELFSGQDDVDGRKVQEVGVETAIESAGRFRDPEWAGFDTPHDVPEGADLRSQAALAATDVENSLRGTLRWCELAQDALVDLFEVWVGVTVEVDQRRSYWTIGARSSCRSFIPIQ